MEFDGPDVLTGFFEAYFLDMQDKMVVNALRPPPVKGAHVLGEGSLN